MRFNEFKKELVMINKDFRKTFNSKNKQYCFGNLSCNKYQSILNNYNQNIFKFLNSNKSVTRQTPQKQYLIILICYIQLF